MSDNIYFKSDAAINPIQLHSGGEPMIRFHLRGKEIGRLFERDGKLIFKGDVDESAKLLFEQVIKYFNNVRELQAMKDKP